MANDLRDILDQGSQDLIVEALQLLAKQKREAHDVVVAVYPSFKPADFGIPKIESLIERFGDSLDEEPSSPRP